MPIALYMLFSPVSVPDFTTVGTHGLNAEFSLLALLGSFWHPLDGTVAVKSAVNRSFSGSAFSLENVLSIAPAIFSL